MFDYDLIVIGGGSGGIRAARIASEYGAKVALVEEYRLGGTCVIRGCVPKKLMVYASRFSKDFKESEGYGWKTELPVFSWRNLKINRDNEISRLEKIYQSNLDSSKVHLFKDKAYFFDKNTIKISEKKITAERILIATGGTPINDHSYSGHEYGINSNDIFDLEELPKKIVVHGGGYIALEFASIFNLLGSEVSIIIRGDKILRGFDKEIQKNLEEELVLSGIKILHKTQIKSIKKVKSDLIINLNNEDDLIVNCFLRAIGRKPNVENLQLEKVGVDFDSNGAIKVNEFSQSTVSNIFAVGDVTNRVNLTPMAIREGHAFADTVFGKTARIIDYKKIPTAVFTTPEVGVIGLTEDEALKNHPNLDVYISKFRPMKSTLSGNSSKVFFKLLVDRETDRVLGFHSIGSDCAEMIQLLGVAIVLKVTKKELDSTLAVHPTSSEEWVTFRKPTKKFGS